MDFAYNLSSNNTPHMKKFQVGATLSTPGVPVLVGGAGADGIVAASTTAAADLVGVTIDTATLVTAQQTDNSDPAATVTCIISPHACYEAVLSGGATSGTALTLYDVTTASTDGLAVTTGDAWDCPDFDEGTVWGYDGANAGVARKITSTSSTAATVMVAFPNDTVVGDNFMRAPLCASPVGMEDQFVQLTTTLDQVDASVTIDTNNNNFRCVELILKDASDNGRFTSKAVLVPFDSIFAAGGSV
jgi:hypothetical protein